MGLTSVLGAATSGLRVTQDSLDVVARNIANAETPGYTRKSLEQAARIVGDFNIGVRARDITRAVDSFLQTQIRTQTADFSHTDVRLEFLQHLDRIFGAPGDPNALDTIVSEFAGALQDLTTTPESFATREEVVSGATTLAQQLRVLSAQVQDLRQLAEDSIDQAVKDINTALGELARVNEQLATRPASDAPPADLLDERDKFLDQLSEFFDITVTEEPNGAVVVSLANGNTLVDRGTPVTLTFDHRGDISASALYSTNDADRRVGTIKLQSSNGFTFDLIANGVLKSGRLGGLVALRDDILVKTQSQLDELAHGLALSFSNTTVAGTAATAGAQQGFDIDTAGLQPGNSITLTYTATPPGTPQTVTIVRVDDASQLPLSNAHTPDPNDTVVGIDFSGGVAAAAAAIDAALGAGVSVSAPGGTTLRFLDDGAAGTTDIDALSLTRTTTAVQGDGVQLPLFVDGGNSPSVYSASLENGPQKLGFAERITVNTSVLQDNELLVRHTGSPQTPLGDPARPLELLARLTEHDFTFSPQSGIGGTQGPYAGTIADFAERVVATQTGQVDAVSRERAAQDVVLSVLRERFSEGTAVDINQELSDLITLQNAFAANARVVQTVNELMQVLLQV